MAWRLAERLRGNVLVIVVGDPHRRILNDLIAHGAVLWDVMTDQEEQYAFHACLQDVRMAIAFARKRRIKLRFAERSGLPFLLLQVGRRKTFVVGAALFIGTLYFLSSFIWQVHIDGTDQPEMVAQALQKLHIYPGGVLYRVLDQDSVQLALLDMLPAISWVGVRIQGTTVYVHIVPRVQPSVQVKMAPQNIVARVPGVIVGVMASYGQSMVKPGQYVAPGTVLISGRLEDGQGVYAHGDVQAIVWYRTDMTIPQNNTRDTLTGQFVKHDYLSLGTLKMPVWGFSYPPYVHEQILTTTSPLHLGGYVLPLSWRVDTVYEARIEHLHLTLAELTQRGLQFAAQNVLSQTEVEHAKVLRQNILQKNLQHGKLYMTVWTEVLENIGIPRSLPPMDVTSLRK